MVRASVRLHIPPDKRDEVLKIFSQLARKIRHFRECLECHVYRDANCDEGIILDQLWSDEKSMIDHLKSPEFRNVLLVSELSTVPPEFWFEGVQNRSGIETIVKARNP